MGKAIQMELSLVSSINLTLLAAEILDSGS